MGGLLIGLLAGSSAGAGVYNLSGGTLSSGVVQNAIGGEPGTVGTFNLKGGTLTLTTTGSSFENGKTAQLNYSAGAFNGDLENMGTVTLTGGGTRIFNGNVTNNLGGFIKSTGTRIQYKGTFTNNGIVKSDPATNLFQDLINGQTGVLQGGRGDVFSVAGNFINNSVQNTAWDTRLATLQFIGAGHHELDVAGSDRGGGPAGFLDNFAWGALALDPGAIVDLFDGNGTAGGALYVRELDLPGHDLAALADLRSSFNIYYDATDTANAYLGERSYRLGDGSFLIATQGPPGVPELSTWVMMLIGFGLVGRRVSRRRGRPIRLTVPLID